MKELIDHDYSWHSCADINFTHNIKEKLFYLSVFILSELAMVTAPSLPFSCLHIPRIQLLSLESIFKISDLLLTLGLL